MTLFGWLRSLGNRTAADAHSRARMLAAFQEKYASFQTLLASNTELLNIISDIEHKREGQTVFGASYIDALSVRCIFHTARMVRCLEQMAGRPYPVLDQKLADIFSRIKPDAVKPAAALPETLPLVQSYAELGRASIDRVGAKNANIGEIRNRLRIPTPRGFAITTAAFRRFFMDEDLADTVRRMKRKADLVESETLLEVSQVIQAQILATSVPEDLARAILEAHDRLAGEIGATDAPTHLSLRSSALGEDSTLSFAGQYLTVLNIPRQRIVDEYRHIIASLFSVQAIAYRLHMALTFEDAVMAVACQETIAAVASGVMFTRSPVDPMDNRIRIDAVWGLGPFAVDGIVPPDTYLLTKDRVPQLIEARAVPKVRQLVADGNGSTVEAAVPEARRYQRCLSDEQAQQLAEYGLRLEAHFGAPQDVEWALDVNGRLVILQSRPLRVPALEACAARVQCPPVDGYAVLLEGGQIACAGIGCGPVTHVRGEADAAAFPDGGVLVSPLASAQLVVAMSKATAILTDTGNISGHMASLAREYMIPTILDLGNATTTLSTGEMVTVDAFTGRIYAGRVPELINADYKTSGIMTDSPVYRDLLRKAEAIVPLNLKDPRSAAFDPVHCRTIHDIMRFVHEKAYGEIFQLGDQVTDQGQLSVRLDAPLPLDLYVIDLGGGLSGDGFKLRRIAADQVVSVPFAALLAGMLSDELKNREPRPVNLGGFMSVMTRQMLEPPNLARERFGDRSYAIISDRYMNFSSRVGYHYSVLDSYCGKTDAKNYINFQFKGGAADDIRRGRRARVIETVLSRQGFLVNTVADRVSARFAKQPAAAMVEKLDMLGRLLIFTRQMDMLMHDDGLVSTMAEAFLCGDYHLTTSVAGKR